MLKKIVTALVVLFVVVLAAAIGLGGPKWPPPMASISDPFKAVDFSTLPPMQRYRAADGASLAYRRYATAPATAAGAGKGSVVLVHGSSGNSSAMHALASAFAAAGYDAYALDMRGHGESGPGGRIAFVGQLESDVEAFMRAAAPPQPATLAGFSAGAGFVLRFAGSPAQALFHDYLLMAPFISQEAPNYRPAGGGWVDVGVPRIVALALLNAVGVRWLNDLPVTRFAVQDNARASLTPEYSYTLAVNFRPQRDYAANMRAVRQPCAVVAGVDDEVFDSSKVEGIVRGLGLDWPVVLVNGVGHIPLTLDRRGHNAAVAEVDALRRSTAPSASK
jgi:alpha-beta hydrolase superfamily lysophospholipase